MLNLEINFVKQEELEMIKQDIDAIIKENKRLHLRIEQTDAVGGPVNMTEWYVVFM